MRWSWRPTLVVVLAACKPGEEPPVDEIPAVERAPLASRRLNRAEHARTVRDLLGVESPVADDLPVDDSSHGFDVVAEALAVSPLLVELWEQAASSLARTIVQRPLLEPIDRWIEAETSFETDARFRDIKDGALALYSPGTVEGSIELPEPGLYRLSARVWGDQAGDEPVIVSFGVQGHDAGVHEVWGQGPGGASWIALELRLDAGRHVIQLEWENDLWDDDGAIDRNFYLDAVRVQGPLDLVPRRNPAWDRVIVCDPEATADARACVRRILERFVPRAWRRPVAEAELDRLLDLHDLARRERDGVMAGLELALWGVLASPHFHLLVEPVAGGGGERAPVDPWVLASRLSYAIWSSMPDDVLFTLAADGTLLERDVVEAQVRRMLRDPKARALVDQFAGQWLLVRALDDAFPDPRAFPGFSEPLRDAMRTSMILLLEDVLLHDRPLTDLLTARHAWLDDALSRHYGLGPTGSTAFSRVDVGTTGRRGWLGTAGLLTATSYPTRTSPVRRGVWVLSALLCDPPDPPPAGVEAFPERSEGAHTVRDRLEEHRRNPACASCHDRIDPVGLAFEHFDGVGTWRDREDGRPVDASGRLPDGTPLDGLADLADVLAADPRYPACVVEKMFTWMHGRPPGEGDRGALEAATRDFLARGASMEALLAALATSETFLTREVRR